MYTMVLTDVLKRWKVLNGQEAILCTGTDEHGMKIQQASAKAGVEPQPFCDKGAEVFKSLAERSRIANDHFVRTTDEAHKEAVEYAWQMLEQRGLIYESKHEGWYSVSDETFYPQSSVHLVVDPPTGRKIMVSIETGKEVEWTSEKNYHFRLSAFREPLLEFYKANPTWIKPEARMADVVQAVEAGVEDLSISRPVDRLTWGIRVPGDESQTMYVWLDALLNYITKVGYPFTPGQESAGGWPADVQVIGKDIVRFHCIYWPAFLMALDLPLPGRILTHAHWTLGKQKMAKSTGNVVNPFWAMDRFGTDTMRFYLVHDGGIASDADYDNKFIIERYKKNLQGGLGNLLSRIMRNKGWDVPRAIRKYAQLPTKSMKPTEDGGEKEWIDYPPVFSQGDTPTRRMYGRLIALPDLITERFDALNAGKALKDVMFTVADANAYLQGVAPWSIVTQIRSAMADTTGQELHDLGVDALDGLEDEIDRCVYLNAEALRMVGILLQPFIPDKAKLLLDMMGVMESRRTFEWCVVGKDREYGAPEEDFEGVNLFPRLSTDY